MSIYSYFRRVFGTPYFIAHLHKMVYKRGMVQTSLITVKLSSLSGHPDNERIYSPTDLSDLESSLETHGQLEPLAVTKDNRIISGHRRYMSMRSLGWEECDIRIVEPDDEIISLIEHNRHRNKTNTDILNEARFLEKQLKNYVGRGRNVARERLGKKQGERLTMAMELSQRLGIGTTKLKQLMSISNYEPKMISRIDSGEISVAQAYEIVRTKHIKPKNITTPEKQFETSFRKFLKVNKPTLEQINATLKKTYPYSIELTGSDEDKRSRLIKHLERLRKMDSRELMLVQKQDELDYSEFDKKIINQAKSLLPTQEELQEFFIERKGYVMNVTTDIPEGKDRRLWSCLRVHTSSFEYNSPLGRSMSATIYLQMKNKKKLLGIVQFSSDAHTLTARDDHIGWTTEQRALKREHIVNMNVCVPSQPFGSNYLGGKFIAMTSISLIKEWEKRYKTKIVGITTTSLHGTFSQYSNMKWWKDIGKSAGAMVIKPLRDEWNYWKEWLQESQPELYAEIRKKTSPTQGILSAIFKIMNIPTKNYTHSHQRGVLICPLYHNYREFLTNKVKQKDLDPIEFIWKDWYIKKATDRYTKLKKEKKLSTEPLFYDGIDSKILESWLNSRGV